MYLKSLFVAGLLFPALHSFAQPSISSNQFYLPNGSSFNQYRANYLPPGSAGANQTWNFSSMTADSTIITNISNNVGAFTSDQQVYDNGLGKIYYNNQSTYQEIIGQQGEDGTVISFINGEKFHFFPMAMGTTGSDIFEATYVTASGDNAHRYGTVQFSVDGYGTLSTPLQANITDVVRVRVEEDYTDSITIAILATTIGLNISTNLYQYYKAGLGHPLVYLGEFITDFGSFDVGFYGDGNGGNVGVSELESNNQLKIFGNPVNDKLVFSIDSKNTRNINYQLLDFRGISIFLDEVKLLTNGENKFQVSMQDLPAGMYCLRILDGNDVTNKLIVKE